MWSQTNSAHFNLGFGVKDTGGAKRLILNFSMPAEADRMLERRAYITPIYLWRREWQTVYFGSIRTRV